MGNIFQILRDLLTSKTVKTIGKIEKSKESTTKETSKTEDLKKEQPALKDEPVLQIPEIKDKPGKKMIDINITEEDDQVTVKDINTDTDDAESKINYQETKTIIKTLEDLQKLSEKEIYINSNIDLNGNSITLPKETILNFNDYGAISNGTLNLSANCVIKSYSCIPCDKLKVVLKGKSITIDGLKWQNTGIALYSLNNCSNLDVKNCDIKSTNNNAIKIIADKISGVNKDILFYNCNIDFERMGAEIQNHGNTEYKISHVDFNICKFTNITTSDYGYGISLTGYGEYSNIIECEFNNCVKGVEIVGFRNVNISRNEFSNISKYAIISSNDRNMTNIVIDHNLSDAAYYIYNTSNSIIENNEINCKYVEIKNSNHVTFANNVVNSTGHYAIMLNQANDNIIKDNIINQKSTSNWSVIRCYGEKAKNNYISSNKITRAKKAGKIWDEYNGASGNKYES